MFKPQIQTVDSRKANSHVLCKRIDGGHIGVVDQIEREFDDVVRFGNHTTIIFTKRLGQYSMDCFATIHRAQGWKDTNVADD